MHSTADRTKPRSSSSLARGFFTDSKPHLKPHSNPYLTSVFSICASSAAVGQQSTLNPLCF